MKKLLKRFCWLQARLEFSITSVYKPHEGGGILTTAATRVPLGGLGVEVTPTTMKKNTIRSFA